MQRLHEAVLDHDPALELAAARICPRSSTRPPRRPLVGREAELARLREEWERARAGAGRLVAVCGPEGMGKTRLAAELAAEVHEAGAVVRYATANGSPAAVLAALDGVRRVAGPTLLVVDDAERAGGDVPDALAELAGALADVPALVLVNGRDPAEQRRDHARAARRRGGGRDRVGAGLSPSGGCWKRAAASRGARTRSSAAGRGSRRRGGSTRRRGGPRPAGARLRSMEEELTGGVLQLQAVQERDEDVDEDAAVVCPFKGLASFDVADAPYFFGRERLVAELVARLVGAPLLGIVGASGSGKSSVLRAGLLPALANGVLPGSETWTQVLMRPGEHPLRELRRATAGVEGPMLLAVDQFEETFTACRDEQERGAFVAELAGGAADRRGGGAGRLLRSLRRVPGAVGAAGGAPRAGGRDAPRRAAPCDRAPRGACRLARRARAGRRAGRRRRARAGRAADACPRRCWSCGSGATAGACGWPPTRPRAACAARWRGTPKTAFGRLDADQQAVARRLLLRLTTDDGAGGVERRRVPLARARRDDAAVLALLTDERLLTVGAGAVELAHEALLREWPRLRGWLDEDAEGRRLHRHLADAAREWDERGRDPGELYRGARLAAALEWRAQPRAATSTPPSGTSSTPAQHEQQAARARRRRALTVGVGLLVIVTGISTILAVRGIQRARYEERAAASRNLAVRAAVQLGDDLRLAGLLGLEAFRREPTVEARSAVLVRPAGPRRLPQDRRAARSTACGLDGVAISPDGRTLASAADDGTVWLWDVATRRRLGRPLAGHAGAVNDVAFSPDGTLLASAGLDRTVRLWDVRARRPIGRPLEGHAEPVDERRLQPGRNDARERRQLGHEGSWRDNGSPSGCGTWPRGGRSAGRSSRPAKA